MTHRFTGLGLPTTRTYWHRMDDPDRRPAKTRAQPWWKNRNAAATKPWKPLFPQLQRALKESVFAPEAYGLLIR